MDRSVKDDDREPFFHLSTSTSSPALAYPTKQQGFHFSADDVLSGYDFQASTQKHRRANTVEQGSSRHHRSGSPVYLAGELFSARKDDSYDLKTVSAVERTIKKYADNILRVLEGMNDRLSQLESVTQGLEHSIASLKASVNDYHGEADAISKALNNNIMEMHRAVQILRDKQDIVEAHTELAKLQASKAEATGEKASAFVPATKQPVVSSQVPPEECYLAVVPNSVQERSSTQLQVPLQQSNEINGQLQQLSLSPDVNTLVSTQGHIQQQHSQLSHVWHQSELPLFSQHQEMIQSMPGVFQLQPQPGQTQQSIQPQQASHALPLRGPGQQLPQAPQQAPIIMSQQSEQAQFQVAPQHLNIQQPLLQQPAVGQPSVQVPQRQFGSMMQILPAQSMAQLQQVQPASSSQLQAPQQISPSQFTVGQVVGQPPNMHHIPNAHLPLQGVPAGQGSLQFTQQDESLAHASLPQGAAVEARYAQAEFGVGPPYNFSNTGSSQQHYSSSQPILSAQHGNSYQRNPLPWLGPHPVYSQTGRPITLNTNARALPVAQNVYNQSVSGGPHISRDDGIVEKVAAMGFSREEAQSVIRRLTDHGQYVDMNAVLNLLMNGRNQSQRGWQAR